MSLTEPSSPSRVRLVRPSLFRSETTGALAPDVRDLLVGLTTLSDDEGWLAWRPVEVAAALYPYAPTSRRLRDLARRAGRLTEAGLLIIHECGCAFLPSLKRDHAVKGGRQTSPVWSWHCSHPVSVPERTSPSEAVPCSVSGSASSSVGDTGSASSRAHETGGPAGNGGYGVALPEQLLNVLSSLANPDDLDGRDLLTLTTFLEERGIEAMSSLEAMELKPETTAKNALAFWALCIRTGIPFEARA